MTIERERLLAEARAVGLSTQATPTLAAVDRRRMQVLGVAVVSLAGIIAIFFAANSEASPLVNFGAPVRSLLIALALGVVGYALDRERRLRRLTRLLVDERALSAALMQRLDEMRAHLEVAKAMNSTASLDAILDSITGAALAIAGGHAATLMLLDGETLHVVASAGAGPARGTQMPLTGSPAGHVTRTWEMVTAPSNLEGHETVYMPVRHGPELLGVLALEANARGFGDYDIRAAELFSEQAAFAIAQTHRAHAAKWERAQRAEQDASRGKAVDNAVHVLRAPIASLVAATKMLQRPKIVDSERLELAAVIQRQTDRLSKAIDEMAAS